MKEYIVITLLFVLLDLCLSNGYTLAKIDKLNNLTDVYGVKEGESSLTITHPKAEKQILREIVYFHVIEKPYDTRNDEVQVATKPSDPDSKRSFTNGHGYQYIKDDNEIIDEPESDDYDDDTERSNESHENDERDDMNHNGIDGTGTINSTDKPDDLKENDDGVLADIDNEYEIVMEDDNVLDKNQSIEDDLDEIFTEKDTDNTGSKEEPAEIQDKPEIRRKRQIDYTNLPDAPSLPGLKLDIFPDYIKAILLEDPDTQNAKYAEDLEEEIEKQVRDLEKAVNHPPSVENGGNGGHKREAKTYGMSLAGDRGLVWNDVNAGHLSYHVGEAETVTSSTSKPEEVPNTTRATTTVTKDETTEAVMNEDHNESKDENTDSDELEDINASFDEIDKLLEELIKEAEKESEVTESDDNTSKSPDSKNDRTTEATTAKSTTETTSIKPTEPINKNTVCEDKSSTENPDNEIPDDKDKSLPDKESNGRKDKNHKDEDSKQKEFVKDLMKNKYFWQWLQDSSAAYLEIMMKKVDVLIQAEVEKQIKQYFEDHKNYSNCNLDNINAAHNTTIEKPGQISNLTDFSEINTTQQPIMNNTLENPIESSNNTDILETTTENPTENGKEFNNIASNETNLDEPIKNGSKTEEDLARKHNNKELDDKKKGSIVKIEAQHVYGSSVGNEKVTNIFIFNIGKESDLANIKPLSSNGTNGVFVFGLDKKPDKEKVDEDHKGNNKTGVTDIAPKPEATNDHTDSDAESNKNKSDINQISNAKPETEPVIDETKENIPEVSEEITEKQTTLKEPSDESTEKPDDDTETATSTTETAIEVTTEPKNPLEEEPSKDITIEPTTESLKDVSKEENKEKPVEDKPNTVESNSATSDNEPKETDNSSTNEIKRENNDGETEMKGADDMNSKEDTKESEEVNTDDKTNTEKENTTGTNANRSKKNEV